MGSKRQAKEELIYFVGNEVDRADYVLVIIDLQTEEVDKVDEVVSSIRDRIRIIPVGENIKGI